MLMFIFIDIAAVRTASHGPIDGSDPYPASNALSGDERCQDSGFTRVDKSANPFWKVNLKGVCTITKVTIGAKGNTSTGDTMS